MRAVGPPDLQDQQVLRVRLALLAPQDRLEPQDQQVLPEQTVWQAQLELQALQGQPGQPGHQALMAARF